MSKARDILKNMNINVEFNGKDAEGYLSKEEINKALSSLRGLVMGMKRRICEQNWQKDLEYNSAVETIANELFGTKG